MQAPDPVSGDRRGLSPVFGAALFVAIVVALAALSASMLLGIGQQRQPAPSVDLEIEAADGNGDYVLVHENGDIVDGDRLRLRGVANANALVGQRFAAGDSVTIDPTTDTVRVVWFEPGGDASYIVSKLEVPDNGGSGSNGVVANFGGKVFTANSSGVKILEGDGGDIDLISTGDVVAALGPASADITGDGAQDLPYVDAGGTVQVVGPDGNVTPVAASDNITGTIETDKTRLAVGSWRGSPTSVFFVNENHDTLYRSTPSGSPVVVATPSDGVQAVVGTTDVDGDGTDELVFADASQQLRYLDPDGSGGTDVETVSDGQTGSNNGIGVGTVADVDGDGTSEVVYATGSNEIEINEKPSGGGVETVSLTAESDEAAKAPLTVADVDGDGMSEIVYATSTDGGKILKYVDDVGGSNTVRVLNDDDGDDVSGSDETGVV